MTWWEILLEVGTGLLVGGVVATVIVVSMDLLVGGKK